MKQLSQDFYANVYSLQEFLTLAPWKAPLLKRACELLGNPIILSDYSHRIIGEHHEGAVRYSKWNELIQTKDYPSDWIDEVFHHHVKELTRKSMVIHEEKYSATSWVGSIFRNDICYGFLSVLEENRSLTNEEQQYLPLLCDIIAVRMAEAGGYFVHDSFHGQLLCDILEGRITDHKELNKRMITRNWARKSTNKVVCIDMSTGSQMLPPYYVARRIAELSKQIKVIEYRNNVLALVEASSLNYMEALCEMIYSQLELMGLRAGVSEVFDDLLDLPVYYFQSSRALWLGGRLHLEKPLHFFIEYILADFFSEVTQKLPYKQYLHKAVLLLRKYDTDNGTTLSDTLYYYLKYDKSLTKSSKALYIHKNTVTVHLDKIKNILKNDLSNTDEMFHMLLTYEMLKSIELGISAK